MNENNNKRTKELLGLDTTDQASENIEIPEEIMVERKFDIDINELPDIIEGEDEINSFNFYDYEKEQTPKKTAKEVDISSLNISVTTELEKDMDIKTALYGGKSVFQIVAAQSGYMAKVTPLVHKDVINLLYSNLSRYEYRKAVFKVVYDKIHAISSGKMKFEEWLKNTSVEDIETFYYGIYCATFPDEGKFTFECPECGNEETVIVKHGNLFKSTDRENMKKLIKAVNENATSEEARKKYSLVGKTFGYQLPDSNIVIEVRVPSLWDSLEILRTVPEKEIDRDTTSVTNMLYISRFLVPSRKGGYIEQKDSREILRIIDNLSLDDASQLQEIVSNKVDEHRISYSIKNLKCPRCSHSIEETPISVEDILFSLIFEKAQ